MSKFLNWDRADLQRVAGWARGTLRGDDPNSVSDIVAATDRRLPRDIRRRSCPSCIFSRFVFIPFIVCDFRPIGWIALCQGRDETSRNAALADWPAMTSPDRLIPPRRTGESGLYPIEAIVSHHDKATLTGAWIVPDGDEWTIPQAVYDAIAALGPDNAYQILGNDKDAVGGVANCLRRALANAVEDVGRPPSRHILMSVDNQGRLPQERRL